MVNVLILIIVTVVVTTIGAAVGYWLYLKTRPKRIMWNADIYTLGDGSVIKENITLNDLRPYGKDILEKIDKDRGVTIYRLVKLNVPTNEPNSSCVDYWGLEDKRVSILKDGDSYTILKKGYDKKTGNIVFQPLPYEVTTMIINQIILKKARLKEQKDILQAITPWIVAGICMLSLVAMVYMATDGYVKVGDAQKESSKYIGDKQVESANIYKDGLLMYKGIKKEEQKLGDQTKPDAQPIE